MESVSCVVKGQHKVFFTLSALSGRGSIAEELEKMTESCKLATTQTYMD